MSKSKRIPAEDRHAYVVYVTIMILTAVSLIAITYFALNEKEFSVSITVNDFLVVLSGNMVVLLSFMFLDDTPISKRRCAFRNTCLTVVVAMATFTLAVVYQGAYESSVPIAMAYTIPSIMVCGITFGLRYAYLNAAVIIISICMWCKFLLLVPFLLVIGAVVVVFSIEWYLLREHRPWIRCIFSIPIPLLTYVCFKLGTFKTSFTDIKFIMYIVFPATVSVAVLMVVYLLFLRIRVMREAYKIEHQNIMMSKNIQESVMASKQYADNYLSFSADMCTSYDIGGDFYDTFMNNSGLRFFIIGDVSGKNMPAAMSMMEAIAFTEAASMDVNSTAEILSTVNRLFCHANRAELFVTMWVGAYDSDTCTLYHSNAGHMFPMLRRGGRYSELTEERGPAVGFDETSEYPVNVTRISEGDSLFLYTDGVTEAFNSSGEVFGKLRLIDILNSGDGPVISRVFSSVKEFSNTGQLSDDLTAVLVSFSECMIDSANFRSDENMLYDILDFINQRMTSAGFDNKAVLRAQISSEEIFINICRYAYFGEVGDVEVICRRTRDRMAVSFIDSGIPFNPLAKSDTDTDVQFGKSEGGFGILLTKKMCDQVSYRYVCGKNIFTMRFIIREDN